jgi:type II secretory pathway pseudopilin PulG
MRFLSAATKEKALAGERDGKLFVAPLEDLSELNVSLRFLAETRDGEATLGAWDFAAAAVESTITFIEWDGKVVAPIDLPGSLDPAPSGKRGGRSYAAWGPLPELRAAIAPVVAAEGPSISSSLVVLRGEASLVWSALYGRANPGELVFETPEGWTLTGVSVESEYNALPVELTRGEGDLWSASWNGLSPAPLRLAATLRRSGDWGAPGQKSRLAAPFLRLASGPPPASRHLQVTWPEELEARALDLVEAAILPSERADHLGDLARSASENLALSGMSPQGQQFADLAVSNSYQQMSVARQSQTQVRQLNSQIDSAPASSLLIRSAGANPSASLEIAGRESDARAEIVVALSIGEDRAEARARIVYDVRFAPAGVFRFALPKGTGRDVKIDAPGLREATLAETPDADVWSVAIQEPTLGSLAVSAEWTLDAKPGEVPILAPEVMALDASSQRGHIALEGSASLALDIETRNLAEIELFELPPTPWPRERRTLAAYRYIAPPYTLRVTARKFRPEDAPEGYAREVELSTALLPEGGRLTRADYHFVPTSDRQFMEVVLPKDARLWAALVNGRGEKPASRERPDGASVLLLPLPARGSGGGEVTASLLYREDSPPLADVDSLDLNGPSLAVPTHKTHWTLHLPPEFEYLRFGGAMGDDKPAHEPALTYLREAKYPRLLAIEGLSWFLAASLVGALLALAALRALLSRMAARARLAGRPSGAAPLRSFLEVALVVALAAILFAMILPNVREAQTRAKFEGVRAELASLSTALESYRADNNAYPLDLSALTTGSVQYVAAVPRDPFSPGGADSLRYRVGANVFAELQGAGAAWRQYGNDSHFWVAYSVGPDGVDQGGALAFQSNSGAGDIAAVSSGYMVASDSYSGTRVRSAATKGWLRSGLYLIGALAIVAGAIALLRRWRGKDAVADAFAAIRADFWVYLVVFLVAGIVLLGLFMALGKGVQAQVATSTQKLVGSVEHDAALDDLGTDGRVYASSGRANKMTTGEWNRADLPASEPVPVEKPRAPREESSRQSAERRRDARRPADFDDAEEKQISGEEGAEDPFAAQSDSSSPFAPPPAGTPAPSVTSPFANAPAGQTAGGSGASLGRLLDSRDEAAARAQAIGLLSLEIALPEGAIQRSFESLDGDANVRVRLMGRSSFVRAGRAAWVGAFVLLGWLALSAPRAYRFGLVAALALSLIVPVALPGDSVAIFNQFFLGAILSLAVPAGRALLRRWGATLEESDPPSPSPRRGDARRPASAATVVAALFLVGASTVANADEPRSIPPVEPETIRLVAPYDSLADLAGDRANREVFIARASFERLWNAARREPLAEANRGALLAQLLLDLTLDVEASVARGELRVDAANPGPTPALLPIGLREAALGAPSSDPPGATLEAMPDGGLALRLPARWAGRATASIAAPCRLDGPNGEVALTFPSAGTGRWRLALPWPGAEAVGAGSLLVERAAESATLVGAVEPGARRIAWRGSGGRGRAAATGSVSGGVRATIDNRLRWDTLALAEWSAIATLEAEGGAPFLPREVTLPIDPSLRLVDARGEGLEEASIVDGALRLRLGEVERVSISFLGFAAPDPTGDGESWTAPGLRPPAGAEAAGGISIDIAKAIEIVSMEAEGLRRQGEGERTADTNALRSGRPGPAGEHARRLYAVDAADWSVALKLRRVEPEFDASVEEIFAPGSGSFARAASVSLRGVGAKSPREVVLLLPEGARPRFVRSDGAESRWIALNRKLIVELPEDWTGERRLEIAMDGDDSSRAGGGDFDLAMLELPGARRVERVAAAWVPADYQARVEGAAGAKSSTPTANTRALASLLGLESDGSDGMIAAWSLPADATSLPLSLDAVEASAYSSAWSLATFAEGRKTLDATLLVEPRRGRAQSAEARVLLAEPDPGAAARLVVTGPIRSYRAEQASDRELRLFVEFAAPRSTPALIRVQLEQPAETSGQEAVGPAILLPSGAGASSAWLVARRDFAGALTTSDLVGAKRVDIAEVKWPASSGFAPQPSDLALELPATIAAPPRFAISRHARDESLRAIVDAMRLRVVATEDGVERHELEIAMQNQSEQFLRVKLPWPSAQVGVVEALVGGEPSKWSFIVEGGEEFLTVPLLRTGLLDPELSIRLAYVVETDTPMARSGEGRFEMPEIGGGVPVSETSLAISLPEEYNFSRFDGTLDKVELVDLDAAELARKAKSAEKLSEAALRSSGATQAAALGKLAVLNEDLVILSNTAEQNVRAHEREAGKKKASVDKEGQRREQELRSSRRKALSDAEAASFNFTSNYSQLNQQVAQSPELMQQAIVFQQMEEEIESAPEIARRAAPLQFPKAGQSFAFRQLQGAGHVTWKYVAKERRGAQYDLLIGAGIVALAAFLAFWGGWLAASRRRLAGAIAIASIAALSFGAMLDIAIPALLVAAWLWFAKRREE